VADVSGAREALLVEDEALVAMVAEEYLMELGFQPLSARTAAEALEILRDRSALTVAVVDVGLPDQRGDELAKRIRILRPELPILMASGYDQGDIRGRFPGDALIGVVSKPYTDADLAKAMAELGVETVSA
jgi:CheY-like chemotaxis protein